MNKTEATEARTKLAQYDELTEDLETVTKALKLVKKFDRLSLQVNAYPSDNCFFKVDTAIREDLVTLLENYKTNVEESIDAL